MAGPTNKDQRNQLSKNGCVTYYGRIPRQTLYRKLARFPGIGLAYMNREYHDYAPSLKFAEYAIMRYKILASETVGLKTQADRMGLHNVTFLDENVNIWASAIRSEAARYQGLEPVWEDAPTWSYPDIHRRQVIGLYRQICANPGSRDGIMTDAKLPKYAPTSISDGNPSKVRKATPPGLSETPHARSEPAR